MSLSMSDDAIRISYRDARQKYRQIGILAELNGCYREEICKILNLTPPESKTILSEAQLVEAMHLYGMHYNDLMIAKSLGVSRQTITRWRITNGLPTQNPNMVRGNRGGN